MIHWEAERYTRKKEGPCDPLFEFVSQLNSESSEILNDLHIPLAIVGLNADLSRIKDYVNPKALDENNILKESFCKEIFERGKYLFFPGGAISQVCCQKRGENSRSRKK